MIERDTATKIRMAGGGPEVAVFFQLEALKEVYGSEALCRALGEYFHLQARLTQGAREKALGRWGSEDDDEAARRDSIEEALEHASCHCMQAAGLKRPVTEEETKRLMCSTLKAYVGRKLEAPWWES